MRLKSGMELFSTSGELRDFLLRSEAVGSAEPVAVADPEKFRAEVVDSLVWSAVFSPQEARDAARRAIHEAAASLGILPASILALYQARGRGELSGFTVPAINVRMLAYDTARAAVRAAHKLDAGAVIFEIARSEIGYT